MPNHVTTTINFSDVETFRKVAISKLNGEDYVDFNILIQQPKDLDGTFDWSEEDKFGFGGDFLKKKLGFQELFFKEYLLSFYNDTITQKEFIDKVRETMAVDELLVRRFSKIYGMPEDEDIYSEPREEKYVGIINPTFIRVVGGFFNTQRYGHSDWYNWRLEHWGTKWNSYDNMISEGSVTFSTAWSTPHEWLEELAKHMDFSFSWGDEDIGANFGIGMARNGNISFTYLDKKEYTYKHKQYLAMTIRGEDYEEDMELYEEEPISVEEQRELDKVLKGFI